VQHIWEQHRYSMGVRLEWTEILLTCNYSLCVQAVHSILHNEYLNGRQSAEDMTIMTWMSSESACDVSTLSLSLTSLRQEVNPPASSSQQLMTYLIISSLSRASFFPMIHSAVRPQ
jgi:hypothetical protein